jgi:hypothetical protein
MNDADAYAVYTLLVDDENDDNDSEETEADNGNGI